jgi:hypothetical protein
LHIAVHNKVEGHHQSDIVDDTNKLNLIVPLKVGQRRKPGSGLHCKDEPLPMVASRSNCGMGCHRAQPACAGIICYRDVAVDHQMVV